MAMTPSEPPYEHDHAAPHSEHEEAAQQPKKRSALQIMLRIVWALFLVCLVGLSVSGGIGAGYLYTLYMELPDIARLEEFRPSLVTKVYDRNDTLIGEFFIEKRALVEYEDLPEEFINALVAVEDKRFFDHFGIDLIGFGRAVIENIKARRFAEGASTITQQLTRVLFLSPEKKIPRKLKEMMLAIQIEQKYRSQARFCLNEYLLKRLEHEDLPQESLDSLQKVEGQHFETNDEMLAVLEQHIGKDAVRQHRALLLSLARQTPEQIKLAAKQKILELYANQLYLGHGTYGVQSAARLYFGKEVPELVLGECAMLAGLPQRPADYSPISNPDLAKERQRHVLRRMVAEGYIEPKEMKVAYEKPFEKKELPTHQINEAPYFVEHVRQYLEERYGRSVYQDGLQVYTTIDLELQDRAQKILQEHLREIQRRHRYTLYDRDKPQQQVEERIKHFERHEWNNTPQKGERLHGIVTEVSSKQITVHLGEYGGTISKKGFGWLMKNPAKVLHVDDIVLVNVTGVHKDQSTLDLRLDIEPLLEGALLSIEPKTGYVLSMVGGYDFYRSKFNRAVQALRQPGSSFKPFVYLAALERGFTPADIIVDEPVTFVIDERTGKTWEPQNFGHNHKGPITLRRGLETSTNIIAAKLIDRIGVHEVIDTARRLGITTYLQPYLSLSLGGSEVYLWELVSAYCAFANLGNRVEPIFVTKVLDSDGNILEENIPRAQQVLPEDVTYLLVSMMQGVVQRGTAAAAKALGRPLAGKTGTTNDYTNAWFVGYSPSLTTGVWVGYDESRKSIGSGETGGKAALPVWIDFMREALKDTPVEEFPVPSGVTFVQIDPDTGLLASPRCGGDPFTEVFRKGTEPREYCYQFRGYSYNQ